MKIHRSTVLVLFAFLLMIMSCQKSSTTISASAAITMAENKQRAIVGLRLVKTNWFLYSTQFNEESWKINSADEYEAKKIHRDPNGTVIWEEDYYYSGRTFLFPPDKGTDWENVTVNYDYTKHLLTVSYVGVDPSITRLFGGSGPIIQMTNNMSIADEILKKWGISKL